MKPIKKCDLCNDTNFSFLFKGISTTNNIQFKWRRCNSCGLIFLDPQPSVSELKTYYSADYYLQNEKTVGAYFALEELANHKSSSVFKLLKPLFKTVRVIRGGKLLDIGCGDGKFLSRLSNKIECYGTDPNTPGCENQSVKLYKKTLDKTKFPEKFFDVVTLYDVLEHLNDPREILKNIYKILKPGGTLIIRSPNCKSLLFYLFGKHWPGVDTPRHLFVFNASTLKKYLYENKFAIEKNRCTSTSYCLTAIILKMANQVFKRTHDHSKHLLKLIELFLYAALIPFSYVCALLNMGDYVEFVARRPIT